jgi:hypothetical protein
MTRLVDARHPVMDENYAGFDLYRLALNGLGQLRTEPARKFSVEGKGRRDKLKYSIGDRRMTHIDTDCPIGDGLFQNPGGREGRGKNHILPAGRLNRSDLVGGGNRRGERVLAREVNHDEIRVGKFLADTVGEALNGRMPRRFGRTGAQQGEKLGRGRYLFEALPDFLP